MKFTKFTNYSHHTVHYVPRIYVSYSWKFVPFEHLQPFSPLLLTLRLWQPPIYSPISMSLIYLDSTYNSDHTVFVFLQYLLFYFVFTNWPILDTLYEWNNTIFVPLYLAYFTQYDVFKVHPCCSLCQNLIPNYG